MFKTDTMMKMQKYKFRKGLIKKLYELEILLRQKNKFRKGLINYMNPKQRIKKHKIEEVVCSVINLN